MNVYIKAQESVCLVHPEIKIKDIMSLYCTDKDLEQKIKNQSVYHFIGNHDQRKCFSVLMLVEVIKQVDKTLDVINLGAEDFIVYYKRKQEESKIFLYGKIVFVILVAFFGASFPNILHISYAAGLAIGIILFFNHAGKIKLNDDPTPFEVQMRLYERDVNDTLMINAGRKGEEADVDS